MVERLSTSFGLSGTVLNWFKSYLSERTCFVVIDSVRSSKCTLLFGVPQGFVLGPVLYTMYTQPLGAIIRKHQIPFHMYADDTQLYKSVPPAQTAQLIHDIQTCIEEIKSWMTSNKLKMNDDKTEIIPCSTVSKINSLDYDHLHMGGERIDFSYTAKNLGVHFDSDLSMDTHIKHLCKALYLELRKLGQLRPFLSVDSAKTLSSAFILSRLDYCNSTFANLPDDKLDRLQKFQNRAARLVLRKPKREHVAPMLQELHWLPVKARIEYKLALICFSTFHSSCPPYISELVPQYTPSRSLRSASSHLLTIPRTKLKAYGDRAFSYTGPSVWNGLPNMLREITEKNSFKCELKTYLFKKYLCN